MLGHQHLQVLRLTPGSFTLPAKEKPFAGSKSTGGPKNTPARIYRTFRVGVGRWCGIPSAALRYDAWNGTLEPWLHHGACSKHASTAWKPPSSLSPFPGSLYVIPNRRCNFRCSYCYAAKSRDGSEMDMDALTSLLEAFYGFHNSGEEVRVSFIGGCEPLLSPHLVERGMRMARRLERERGVKTTLGLVTNGSLLSDNLIMFLAEIHANVEVSFDVLRDVQEAQRGPYTAVAENVRKASRRLQVTVRTVATRKNVERLDETVRECALTFPEVHAWRCDPDMDATGREFFRSYTTHFIRALETAKENEWNLRVENTATRCLAGPAIRFCGISWVAGPTGTISRCPCDDGTMVDIVGHFGGWGVEWQKDLPEIGSALSESCISGCERCFLRWNCAGGCPARRRRSNPVDWKELCRSQRTVASWVLAKQADLIWGEGWAQRKSHS